MMTALVLRWCVVRRSEHGDGPICARDEDPINTIRLATPSSHYSPILTNNVINIIDTQHNHLLMSFTLTTHEHIQDAQLREEESDRILNFTLMHMTCTILQYYNP